MFSTETLVQILSLVVRNCCVVVRVSLSYLQLCSGWLRWCQVIHLYLYQTDQGRFEEDVQINKVCCWSEFQNYLRVSMSNGQGGPSK